MTNLETIVTPSDERVFEAVAAGAWSLTEVALYLDMRSWDAWLLRPALQRLREAGRIEFKAKQWREVKADQSTCFNVSDTKRHK